MKMKFIESIKVKDGEVFNEALHMERFHKTCEKFFARRGEFPDLKSCAGFPEKGLHKARIVYGETVESVEFIPYSFKKILTAKMVESEKFDYSHKALDRSRFDWLLSQKESCDEIIITIGGVVCDSSYSNLVFEKNGEFFTPSSRLLNGTKRRALLKSGAIREIPLAAGQVKNFDRVFFINAMIDLDDAVCIPTSSIL